jgi:hypothetical protein
MARNQNAAASTAPLSQATQALPSQLQLRCRRDGAVDVSTWKNSGIRSFSRDVHHRPSADLMRMC